MAQVAQVKLWLELGEITKAAEWLDRPQSNQMGAIIVWRECEEIVSVHVLLALGRYTEAQSQLARRIRTTEGEGRIKPLIEMLVPQALALDGTDNKPEALESLKKALILSQSEGYIRIFLEEGETMFRVLCAARS